MWLIYQVGHLVPRHSIKKRCLLNYICNSISIYVYHLIMGSYVCSIFTLYYIYSYYFNSTSRDPVIFSLACIWSSPMPLCFPSDFVVGLVTMFIIGSLWFIVVGVFTPLARPYVARLAETKQIWKFCKLINCVEWATITLLLGERTKLVPSPSKVWIA